MKVAELFVKCLEQQGVQYIFGVPGEENIDFLDALHQSSIQFIACRDETNAAFIAGMMGKLTGQPGVCLSTLGPGATNMMTGTASAALDRNPLIVITAQTDVPLQYEGTHQYINTIEMYRPIVKWNASIESIPVLPKIVADAFSSALSSPFGAVHLELPHDVASKQIQESIAALPETQNLKRTMTALDSAFEDAARVIQLAQRPLVLIGRRAAEEPEISAAVLSFVETLKAPFTETYMAKGVVSGDHPLHLQTIGLPEGDYVNTAFEIADLIIAIGYDSIEYGAKKWNKAAKPIVHIDLEVPAKINTCYPIKASLIGDIAGNLQSLTERMEQRHEMASVYQQLKDIITKDLRKSEESDAYPLVPQRIIKEIREFLSEDDLLVSDVGAHKHWIARQYPAFQANTCIFSNGLASMGVGLPWAIGAKMAFPNKRVMAVCGDGSFNMSLAELETAVRLELPIVVMIWRDGRYSAIEWEQENKQGRSMGIQFGNPDFVQLATAYGVKGYKINKATEIGEVLPKAFSEKSPVLIECEVDYTENFRLSERLGEFKSMFLR